MWGSQIDFQFKEKEYGMPPACVTSRFRWGFLIVFEFVRYQRNDSSQSGSIYATGHETGCVCVHCQFTAQVILDASHFRDGKSRKAVWTT